MRGDYGSRSARYVTSLTQIPGNPGMTKGALAILVHGGTENWSPARWKGRFDEVCGDRRVLLLPSHDFDPREVHYAAVWKPRPGELADFPNLRVIFNRDVFAKLSRNGPLGAPVLINAGRGGLQNEPDILACLDDGTLGAASLDVFETEPLPAASPFWSHPKVVLTPHNAADTDPDEISKYVAQQIERFEAGGA